MEEVTAGSAPAVAEPTDQSARPSAQPTAGGSGDWLDREPSDASKVFRDLVSGANSRAVSVTSKPDGQAAAAGESTPTVGDVKPAAPERGADGKFVPRRGVPQALSAAEAKVAELERQLAERDPEKLRQQWERERETSSETAKLDELATTNAKDVERYRALLEVPDDDLYRDNPADYEFREQFKARLKALPEVETLHREYARQTIAAKEAELTSRETAFLNGQYEQVATLAAKAGIDPEKWKAPGTTFASMAEDYATAREAKVRSGLGARIRALEDENRQLRMTGPRGLASARSGLNGGASGGSGAPTVNDNELFRRVVSGQPLA